jgi:hypothetical protein
VREKARYYGLFKNGYEIIKEWRIEHTCLYRSKSEYSARRPLFPGIAVGEDGDARPHDDACMKERLDDRNNTYIGVELR